MRVFLVCFDISDDRLRRRVAKVLLEYGDRVQKSVFEVVIQSAETYQALLDDLQQLIAVTDVDEEEDDDEDVNIRFYRLCKTCQSHSHSIDEEQIDFAEVAYFPASVVV